MMHWWLACLLLAEMLGPQTPAGAPAGSGWSATAPAPVLVAKANPKATPAAAQNTNALTLSQAVARALDQSPAAQRARLVRDAALEQAGLLKPRLRPDLTFTAQGGIRTPTVRDQADPHAVMRRDLAERVELTAEQILFAGGRGSLGRKNAATEAAAQADCEAALAKIELDVANAWLDVAQAQAGVALADEGVAQAEAQAKRVADLLSRQRVAEVDQLQAKAGVLEAKAGQVEANNGLMQACANLRRLMGDKDLGAPLATAQLADDDSPLPDLGESIAYARAHRPEIIALTARVAEANAGAALARSLNGPTVSAVGGVAAQSPTNIDPSFDANLGLVLRVPLSRTDNESSRNAAEARAGAKQAELGLVELADGVEMEVRKAYADAQTAAAKVALADERIKAAQGAYEIKQLQYDRQRATLIDVQQARLELSKARMDRLSAQAAEARARAALTTAIGRADDGKAVETAERKPAKKEGK